MRLLIYIIIIAIVLVTIVHFWLPISIAIGHLFHTIYYGVVDSFYYIYHKKYNNAPTGFIDMYTGLFGRGKTLSMVHYIVQYYNRYNNKTVWDDASKKFVKQYVNVLSNVDLKIPYKQFISMEQVVEIADQQQHREKELGCHIINLACIDECSTQLNSRSFKTNFSTPLLNSLLCCRHFRMAFCLSSQKYSHVDKLMRDVTSRVIECNKIWRLQCQSVYDPDDLENAGSMVQLRPLKHQGFFVKNSDYAAYDTLAVVKNMIKDYEKGEMLSDAEILELQGETEKSEGNIRRPSRKLKKRLKAAS